jgi:lipopolysaccharide export system permease protein
MTLLRYLLRLFLRSVSLVFLVILLVVMLFATVENLRRYATDGIGFGDVFRITLLQSTETLYQAFPLVLMLASLATFLRLARSSELVVMRAAGISALRLIGVPVLASMVIGALFVAGVNPFVAASLKRAIDLDNEFTNSGQSLLSFSSDGIWLRQADPGGQTVIQAERANATGTVLDRVRLHRFDADGTLYSRIEAPNARLEAGAWRFDDARVWQRSPRGDFLSVADGGGMSLPTDLTSAEILDSFSPPEMIGFWKLKPFISRIEESGFSGQRHRLFLQGELAKPAFFAAMVLIGAAFALRPTRFGQTGVMVLLAVLAGFSLYFLRDFAQSLGAQGSIPLGVAVWTPPAAAILLAVGLLLHLEDG